MSGELSGKHYEQAMNYHKQLLESLERLLFQQYIWNILEDQPLSCLPDETMQPMNFLVISCLKH